MATRQNTVLLKRSNVIGKIPPLSGLTLGEMALNTADAKLYSLFTSGTTGATEVRQIGWDRISRTGDTVTGDFNFFGDISISGSVQPNGYALTVTGDTDIVGDLYVEGDIDYDGNLIVSGSGVFQSGLTANTIYTDYIDFNTGATVAQSVGRINWDSGTGTLNINVGDSGTGLIDLQVGQEEIVRVYNAEATTLIKGEIVYVSGSQGNRPAVKRAQATSDGYSVTTLGMVDRNITSGSEGYVTTFGIISNLNTLGLTGGTPIWLSGTVPGGYTSAKPIAPLHTVLIGYVVRVSATVGSIFVNISNGWELDELHDVRISAATEGDLLMRSSFSGTPLWVNTKTLNGSYTITGNTNIGGNLTVSGNTTLQSITGTTLEISGNTSSDLVKITQTGSGNAFVVEDITRPDSTPFVINTSGNTGIGTTTPQAKLDVRAQGNLSTDIAFRVRNSGDTVNFLVVNGAGDVYNNGARGISSNTFYGENVGRNNTGAFNTFIGYLAGLTSGTTSDSTFIGFNAGRSHASGIRNTYVGSEAGSANTNGSQNTFIGRGAGGSIIGSSNTSVGGQSFSFVTTGSNNVTLGSEAGLRISTGTNTTTSNNSIFIGFDTRANADSQTNQIVIGHTAIGLGSNTTVIGNTGTTLFRPYGNVVIDGNLTVSGNSGTSWFSSNTSSDLVRITQTGSGNAFVVEDSTNPDSTPFIIDTSGNTAIGVTTSPLSFKLEVNGTSMFRNNMFLNQATFSEVYTYNSVTDNNKVNLTVSRFHDHNDGAVDRGYTAQLGWSKRQSSNISLARSIDIPVVFTSGSSGTVGQFNSINTDLQIGEGSTITTPFVAHSVSATKGTTGTVTSFTGFDVQDNSVSNTIYGFRSRLTSGSGKYGLYFDGTANNYFNGNVGIGTLTPRERLDVSGNTIISSGLTATTINVPPLADNKIVYTTNNGRLTTTSAFTYNQSNNTFSVNNIDANGNFNITGNTTQSGNTNQLGNFNITGNTGQIGNFTITGNTTQSGNTTQYGNVDLTGNTNQIGNFTITGNTIQSGNTTQYGNIDLTGNTTQIGSVTLSGNTFITGNTDQIGNVNITGDTVIDGSLSADTITITTTPVLNNNLEQILGRTGSTGDVQYREINTLGNNYTYVSGATYSALTTDNVLGVDSSISATTIYLPDSVSSGRLRYDIKDIGLNSFNNNITIVSAGSDTIISTENSNTVILESDGGALVIFNTGTGTWLQM